jgi:hypothetical protein
LVSSSSVVWFDAAVSLKPDRHRLTSQDQATVKIGLFCKDYPVGKTTSTEGMASLWP